ncbi:MAG: archaellin/type IV pilin N-terminal domain-containing protein [Candidatus Methanofastidiosia archaeon]
MNEKGITPIIAALLLILITVSIATIFYIQATNLSQSAIEEETRRRDRAVDKKGEILTLNHVEYITTPCTEPDDIYLNLKNTGTSDSEITYILVTYTDTTGADPQHPNGKEYITHDNFNEAALNGIIVADLTDPIPFDIDDLLEVCIDYNGEDTIDANWIWDLGEDADINGIFDTISSIEIGTILGNRYIYTRPTALITVKDQYELSNNQVFVFDGSLSSDNEGYIVSWEWRFYCDPDFDPPNHDPFHPLTEDALGTTPIITFGEKISYVYDASAFYDAGLPWSTGTYYPYILLKVTDETGMANYVLIRISVNIP